MISERYVCLTQLYTQTLVKRTSTLARKRKKDSNLQRILAYADLSVGDFVVHETHGIGQYVGMSSLTVEGVRRDFLKIRYAGTDMLYLPCEQLDKISKYIGKGAEDGSLKLSRMAEPIGKRPSIKQRPPPRTWPNS